MLMSTATPRVYVGLGLVLTLIGRLWVLTLPDKQMALTLIKTTSIPLAIVSVLETLLLGELLAREVRRQETENALSESEQRFAKIFHASPVAIAISTLQGGYFVDANDSFVKLIGLSRDEVIGHNLLELNALVDPQQRAKIIGTLTPNQRVQNWDLEIR